MTNLQQHIINKVSLDVHTNSKTVAYELRDSLPMFLKRDILPYIEAYFDSIDSTLPSEIVQIPKLDVEVTLDGKNNLEELKERIKSEVVSKINVAIEPSGVSSQMGVEFINTNDGALKTFFFFIEKGVSPWWKTSAKGLDFSSEVITKLVTKPGFSSQFIKLLEQIAVQERLIKQFSDEDLIVLFDKAYTSVNVKELISTKLRSLLTCLTAIERLFVWQQLIDYFQSCDVNRLIKRFSKVYQRITTKHALQQANNLNQFVLCLMKPLVRKNSSSFKVVWNTKDEISFSKQATAIELYVVLKTIERITKEIKVSNQSEKLAAIKVAVGFETESNIGGVLEKTATENTAYNKPVPLDELSDESIETAQWKKAIQQENTIEKFETNDINQPKENQIVSSDLKSKESHDSNEEEPSLELTSNASNYRTASEGINDATSDEDHQKAILKSQDRTVENSSSEKENNNITLDQIGTTAQGSIDDDILTEAGIDRDLKKKRAAAEVLKSNKTESSSHKNKLDKEVEDKAMIQKKFAEFEHILKNATKTALKVADNSEDYYVPNAGLIILHPFLKHFFKNCQLLDAENNFTDVDTAIHLLHYVATRQENQLESNLMFEKFLCGLPITESIRRDIKLTDSLKEEADALLASVIQNWEVLKNASGDLLRNEFLKREGKLSFKEEHPKITIARKTQDILLDKLPWNLGLCKLPWREHLIFTDW